MKDFSKFLRFLIVFFIIWTWTFIGWPRIWPIGKDNSGQTTIPPKIKEARGDIASGDGILVYGEAATTTQWSAYTGGGTNSFSASQPTNLGTTTGASFFIATSPTQQEAVAVFASSSTSIIKVLCYDGTSWSLEWTAPAKDSRPAAIAYERNSGDVMVLYSNTSVNNNELSYRTKSGTTSCGSANWSSATNLSSANTNGGIQWVKMVSDRRASSNLIAAVWVDSNKDLSGAIWDGTTWSNEPSIALETNLKSVGLSADVDSFDIDFESDSGDVMVVWGNAGGNDGTNGAYYATCTGGTSSCTWSSTSTITSLLDDATHIDIASNLNSDEIVFASVGSAGSDLQAAYWDGSSWTGTPNLDESTAGIVSYGREVGVGWLASGSTYRSVIVYNDSAATNVGWVVGNGSVFTVQTDFTPTTAFANPQKWYEVSVDPLGKDNLMFVLSDTNNDLHAKKLTMDATPTFTWSESDGGSAIETSLVGNLRGPFSFAYWSYAPSAATISCATDISATDFSAIDPDSVFTSSPNSSTTMTCSDTSSGCSLKINDAGGGGNPGLWNSTSSALIESPDAAYNATATLVADTEGYGIQATTTTTGSGGALTVLERYLQSGNTVGGLSVSQLTLASSSADATNREVIITYKAAVSSTTPGGNYDDSITLSCYVN